MTITGIQPNTSIKKFLSGIIHLGYNIKVINPNSHTNVGTGTKIQFFRNNQLEAQFTAIIYGDITGNGLIDKNDLNLLNQYLLKVEPLNKHQLTAADVNHDGRVNNKDLLLLNKYLANDYSISQDKKGA